MKTKQDYSPLFLWNLNIRRANLLVRRMNFCAWALALSVLSYVETANVHAGCYCMMQSQGTGATYNLFGFQEFVCSRSTPPKFYLQLADHTYGSETSDTGNLHFDLTTTTIYSISNATDGIWDCSWSSTPSVTYSGTAYLDGDSTTMDTNGNWIATATNSADCWSQAFDTGCGSGTYDCFSSTGLWCWRSAADNTTNCTSTENDIDQTSSFGGTNSFSDHATLSSQFTPDMLRGQILAQMPAYSSTWYGGPSTAYFYIATDTSGCAGGGKMQYQLKVPNSDKNTSYQLAWSEVTTTVSATSTNISFATKTETITGTGDPVNAALGTIHPVDMPSLGDGEISKSVYETAPEIVNTTGGGGTPSVEPGDGGPGSSGTGGTPQVFTAN